MLFPGRQRYDRIQAEASSVVIDGVRMGSWISGDRFDDVLPTGEWYWPRKYWRQHALVMGAPGGGKTQTVLRAAYGQAARPASPGEPATKVFYFDAKPDPDLPGLFGALMAAQGREPYYFPWRRIDLWRGDARDLRYRLMRVIPYATEGAGTWFRDIAGVLMEYVCSTWPEPPYSSAELFRRFAEAGVLGEPRHPLLAWLDEDKVGEVALRYQNLFASPGVAFDGDVGFDEIDTGYFQISPKIFGGHADFGLCMLFLDFVHYCKERKPREQRVLLVLDEFSALAEAFEMDRMAEDLRSFNVSLVFVPQSLEGMGSEDQRARLLKAARLKVVHRYEDPESLLPLVGRRLEPDFSLDLADELGGEGDRVRWVERWRVAPEELLRLVPGEAIVIREGLASKVKVDPPPRSESLILPEPESIDRVYEWSRGGSKKAEANPESELEPDDEAGCEPDEVDEEASEAGGEGAEADEQSEEEEADEEVVASRRVVVTEAAEVGSSEVADEEVCGEESGSPSPVFGEGD